AIEKITEFGGRVVACSDSSGYVVDDRGIDLALLKEIKEVRRARIEEYVRRKGVGAHYIAGGSIWDVQCDVAMPCATQNELTGRDALSLVRN
ncbi:glutamate dehydrogenase, partial [Acinetobacter baumannii]